MINVEDTSQKQVASEATPEYRKKLEDKVSAMGWSLWIPFTLIRTQMWAIYTDKKQKE